ncbi:MAG: hypothetical protein NQU45_00005 [Methanothermobacter sp.]|nr:hypothetical protein [Methanothermobacter thermautotrophicus]MCQ8904089.1 hypothetical protein [Methanothermobacter sp.]
MQFEKLEKIDTGFIWINIILLMVVAMVPLLTNLISNMETL